MCHFHRLSPCFYVRREKVSTFHSRKKHGELSRALFLAYGYSRNYATSNTHKLGGSDLEFFSDKLGSLLNREWKAGIQR